MKISRDTIEALKHFSTINSNLLVTPGSEINTVNIAKTVRARIPVVEDFPLEFGIYNLSEFLASLSLFDDPELTFKDDRVTIVESNGKGKLVYMAATKDILVYPENKKPLPDRVDFEFDLSADDLNKIMKAYGVLGAPDLFIESSTQTGVTLKVGDRAGKVPNAYSLKIADSSPTNGSYIIKIDNLKLMAGSYKASVLMGIMIRFESNDGRGVTHIALDS